MISLGFNERRVLELLRSFGPISRAELAQRLDVSAPTLTRLANTLLDKRLVREEERGARPSGEPVRGKPSTLLSLRADGLHSLGVFFNPDEIKVCVADLKGTILAEYRSDLTSNHFDDIMGQASAAAREVMGRAGLEEDRLIGCGLAFPGHFSKDSGHLTKIPQFADWRSISAPGDFEPFFDTPVHHENDGKAAAIDELYYGAGSRRDNFALVLLTYGIGGGIVVRRTLYRGSHRNAAEFGGIFPKSRARPSGQDLCNLLEREGLPVRRLRDIEALSTEHPVVRDWIERAAEQLRMLSLVLARTLDPSEIIFGGSLPGPIIAALVARIKDGSLGENFDVEAPEISVSHVNDFMHRAAATIPLYRAMNPSHYNGRAIKGW